MMAHILCAAPARPRNAPARPGPDPDPSLDNPRRAPPPFPPFIVPGYLRGESPTRALRADGPPATPGEGRLRLYPGASMLPGFGPIIRRQGTPPFIVYKCPRGECLPGAWCADDPPATPGEGR